MPGTGYTPERMKWVVDSRGKGESEIYKLLVEHARDGIEVERRAMDVGDYQLINDDGEVCVVVERKTHSDLAQSLKVKQHMKEQMVRLRAFKAQNPQAAVFLVYEGGVSGGWFKQSTHGFPNLSGDMYVTVAASREGVCTHSTGSKEHTAAWLVRMALKEAKGELRGDGSGPTEAEVLRTLATSKAGNLTSSNQWARMLMAINGISAERALAIAERYPSCRALVEDLENNPADTISNLTVKRRRLGPAAARNVISAITN